MSTPNYINTQNQTPEKGKDNHQPSHEHIFSECNLYYTIWGTDGSRGIDYPIMAVRGLQNALNEMLRLAPKQENPFCSLTLYNRHDLFDWDRIIIAYTRKTDDGKIVIKF